MPSTPLARRAPLLRRAGLVVFALVAGAASACAAFGSPDPEPPAADVDGGSLVIPDAGPSTEVDGEVEDGRTVPPVLNDAAPPPPPPPICAADDVLCADFEDAAASPWFAPFAGTVLDGDSAATRTAAPLPLGGSVAHMIVGPGARGAATLVSTAFAGPSQTTLGFWIFVARNGAAEPLDLASVSFSHAAATTVAHVTLTGAQLAVGVDGRVGTSRLSLPPQRWSRVELRIAVVAAQSGASTTVALEVDRNVVKQQAAIPSWDATQPFQRKFTVGVQRSAASSATTDVYFDDVRVPARSLGP